jgi:hypothetical protein
MKKIILLSILFLFSCEEGTSENSAGVFGKLKVLVVSFYESDLNAVVNPWSESMPNYTFTKHMGNVSLTNAQLDTFDVVLLFTNTISNQEALGDTLYNYVNNGGKLILATFFSQQTTSKNFGDLSSIVPMYHNGDAYIQDTLINDTSHPLLAGIDTLITYYGAGSDSLENNAKGVGRWNNNDIYAAYNEHGNGRILEVTMFPSELDYRADLEIWTKNNLKKFYRAWANAIRYVHSKTSSSSDFDYTEPVEEETGDGDGEAAKSDFSSATSYKN